MDIIYEKLKLVKVQDVNLKDPKGKPISLDVSFGTDTINLSVAAWDDLNNIGRSYELAMDDNFKAELTAFFLVSVSRLMSENYAEFKGLTLV